MDTHFWLSTPAFTIGLTIDKDDIITDIAPILYKFKGQNIKNLSDWIAKKKIQFVMKRICFEKPNAK